MRGFRRSPGSRYRPILARAGIVVIVIGMAVGLSIANLRLAGRAGFGERFRSLWLAARTAFLEGNSPYSPESMAVSYEAAFGTPPAETGSEGELQFSEPLPLALLAAPLIPLEYPLARGIWLTSLQIAQPLLLLLGLSLVSWRWRVRELMVMLGIILTWRPGVESMLLGPALPLVLLPLFFGLWHTRTENDFLAGLSLGLALIAPALAGPTVLFTLLWSASKSRWRLIAGSMVAGLLPWVALLVAVDGWLTAWLASVVMTLRAGGPPTLLIQSTGPAFYLPLSIVLGLYLIWQWIVALGKEPEWFVWTAAVSLVITSILVGPPEPVGLLLTSPGLLLTLHVMADRWGASGGAIAAVVGFLLLAGPWLPLILDLPNPLATGMRLGLVPAIALLGLWWSRWWAVQQARLPLEGAAS